MTKSVTPDSSVCVAKLSSDRQCAQKTTCPRGACGPFFLITFIRIPTIKSMFLNGGSPVRSSPLWAADSHFLLLNLTYS